MELRPQPGNCQDAPESPQDQEKEEIPLRFDLNRLAEQDVKTSFAVETENRFEALPEHWDESSTPNENWGNMEDIWIQSATDIIGKAKKQKTKPWISDQVIDMAVKKREAKKKGDHIEYNWLKREIQRMIRRDKNSWLEKECAQIDEYDRFGKAIESDVQQSKISEETPLPSESSLHKR